MKINEIVMIFVYIMSVSLANLSAAEFGVWVTPINAFFLIGLEITTRDVLHTKITKLQMICVIITAGVISFLINQDTTMIAVASFVSIVVSCGVDYFVFERSKGGWWVKSNKSNVYSSLTDSILFPTIAFGQFNIVVILLQFSLKVFGGLLWSSILIRFVSGKYDMRTENSSGDK